jgi:hypothetical protein
MTIEPFGDSLASIYLFDIGVTSCHYVVNHGCIEARSQGYILVASTDKALRVKNSVAGVHRSLILCGITNQTLLRREGDVGRCSPVTLCTKTDVCLIS